MEDNILKELNKKYGRVVIAPLKDAIALRTPRISSGCFTLDLIIGGGFPRGKLIEYYGKYSSGKTMLALKAIAAAQKRGEKCLFVDMEGSIAKDGDFRYLKSLGVDVESLLLACPESTEQAMDIIVECLKSDSISLIVYDSLAMSTPMRVYNRESDSDTMGIEPRQNNLLIRKIIASLQPKDLTKETTRPTVLIINQVRDVLGLPFAQPQPTGGWGLKFGKHISVEVKMESWIGADEEEVKSVDSEKYGQEIRLIVRKNKTFRPYLTGNIRFYFRAIPELHIMEGSLDLGHELLELGTLYGVIERQGTSYVIEGQKVQGKKQARLLLRTDENIRQSVMKQIEQKFTNDYSLLEDKKIVEVDLQE